MLSIKNAIRVLVGAILLFLSEYSLYLFTRMPQALNGGGPAAFIVYQFQWLMILTVAVGLFAPIGAIISEKLKRPLVGFAAWACLVVLSMIGYTSVVFLGMTASPLGLGMPASMNVALQNAKPKISEMVSFAGSKIEQVDPGTIRVELQFKNQTDDEYTEIDYNFAAIDGDKLFYRIKIRDGVYLPPGIVASTTLTWRKADFKDPALFNRIFTAQQGNKLKVYARAERLVRIDGKAIEA